MFSSSRRYPRIDTLAFLICIMLLQGMTMLAVMPTRAAEAPRVHGRASDVSPVTETAGGEVAAAEKAEVTHAAQSITSLMLSNDVVLVPEVGTEAVFYITEMSYSGVAFSTGLFAFADDDDPEETAFSVRARYVVKDRDIASHRAQIDVEAWPFDSFTGEILSGQPWSATYTVTMEGVEWEKGDVIPLEYADIVEPGWLTNWILAEQPDIPKQQIVPGDQWSSSLSLGTSLLGNVSPGETYVALTGEFLEWIELPGVEQPVAHVVELMEHDSATIETLNDGLTGLVSVDVDGASNYWLIPGQFPYGAEQWLGTGVHVVVSPEYSGPVGFEGEIYYEIEYVRMIEMDPFADDVDLDWTMWDTSSEEAWMDTTEPIAELYFGQSVVGRLTPMSDQYDDGTYMDVYTYFGLPGEIIEITLISGDFDAFLFLVDKYGEIVEVDDDSAGGTDARIRTTLPDLGTYTIIVNTIYPGETGTYTVRVDSIDAEL